MVIWGYDRKQTYNIKYSYQRKKRVYLDKLDAHIIVMILIFIDECRGDWYRKDQQDRLRV